MQQHAGDFVYLPFSIPTDYIHADICLGWMETSLSEISWLGDESCAGGSKQVRQVTIVIRFMRVACLLGYKPRQSSTHGGHDTNSSQ